ncbi:uncharacterized protein LOC133523332 [Cydia pomonella]|uniref:uncharacterized protein LOC133523332 n=1 Tax=Cydia pomonella TaxID=82600 RepID=UPI002ADDE61A|nr:uncharacterized protein LOC133523332 [Cydia pomonella]XP_061714832.1 uncharacterized protein LOC133523332 [Cydia pomonella]
MLLIWLLLIPSVAAFVCKGACEHCAKNMNQGSASCALCRDCKRFENRRMMESHTRIPILNDQQKNDLKELEKFEFKQVMKEYGLKPEDLIDTDIDTSMQDDTNSNGTQNNTDPNACIDFISCFAKSEENFSGKLLHGRVTLTTQTPKKKCRNMCSPRFTPSPTRTTRCPPVTPCKKALMKITRTDGRTRSTLPPHESILSDIVTLGDSDYDLNDQGCPTQPSCSDYEDYEMRVTKRGSVSPPKIVTKTCCPKKLLKMLTTTPACVTCMPFCQQPCAIVTQIPFLPTSMPQETRETLITVKPMTAKNIPTESSEEKEKNQPKEEITKSSTEGTTKDYIYVYVGVPKDVKHLRKG